MNSARAGATKSRRQENITLDCLEGTTIVYVGDSTSRYEYLEVVRNIHKLSDAAPPSPPHSPPPPSPSHAVNGRPQTSSQQLGRVAVAFAIVCLGTIDQAVEIEFTMAAEAPSKPYSFNGWAIPSAARIHRRRARASTRDHFAGRRDRYLAVALRRAWATRITGDGIILQWRVC